MENKPSSDPTETYDSPEKDSPVKSSPLENASSATNISLSDAKSQSSATKSPSSDTRSQSSTTKRLLSQELHKALIGNKDDIRVVPLKKSNCCCTIC